MGDQDRIINLQAQVRHARKALERIRDGTRCPEAIAEAALDVMFNLDQKQPLQGLVGHERRKAT